MLLNRIKTLLNIEGNEELILEIVNITEAKILNYINVTEMPVELEFVLIELAIQRFNRIGSEGISSESIDGILNVFDLVNLIRNHTEASVSLF